MKPRHLLFAFLLTGCGGGGSSFVEGTTGAVALSFVRGTGYTGSSTSISTFDRLNGSAIGDAIDASVTLGTRSVSVTALNDPLVTGTVIDLTGGAGSSVTYRDPNGTWIASSGTITVTSRGSASVTLTFTNVVIEASSGGAAGAATMSGTLTFTTA